MSKTEGNDDNDDERTTTTSTSTGTPQWCPNLQIYIGGTVPSSSTTEIQSLLTSSNDDDTTMTLRLFGYGSLIWNPGEGILSHAKVTKKEGNVHGWKRCWAQRSADHRGTPAFLGLVCTLLRDEEYWSIVRGGVATEEEEEERRQSVTEGLIYEVPTELVEECLSELDFREKGGYARDVIDVVEDDTGKVVKALLYRGTPQNPAFWTRALVDLPFAAAIMSVATGPSGKNDEYLYNLDTFLSQTLPSSSSTDDDTRTLAKLTRHYQNNCSLHFLYGCGSNQYGQLLFSSSSALATAGLLHEEGDVAHDLKEMVLVTIPDFSTVNGVSSSRVRQLFAGGSHCALLTTQGALYFWGGNDKGQLGRQRLSSIPKNDDGTDDDDIIAAAPVVPPVANMTMETAALGHAHTLLIEKGTGKLYAFGDDSRCQVSGGGRCNATAASNNDTVIVSQPSFAVGHSFCHVAAGLFHSAAISTAGEVFIWGSGGGAGDNGSVRRWHPPDNARLVNVKCGRKHTILLDDRGRVWACGTDNRYGQLGRGSGGGSTTAKKKDFLEPQLVQGLNDLFCVDIDCGWSHNVALVKDNVITNPNDDGAILYGWGRNDKGQLGIRNNENGQNWHAVPRRLSSQKVKKVSCGAESTMLVDENNIIHGCGWNEHGNVGVGHSHPLRDIVYDMTPVTGAKILAPPTMGHDDCDGDIIIVAGGAHFLAMMR